MHLIPKDELEQHHAVCPDKRMDMYTPSNYFVYFAFDIIKL